MGDCHCSRPFIIEAKSMIFSVGPKPSSLPAVGYSFELAQLAIMFFVLLQTYATRQHWLQALI